MAHIVSRHYRERDAAAFYRRRLTYFYRRRLQKILVLIRHDYRYPDKHFNVADILNKKLSLILFNKIYEKENKGQFCNICYI